MYSRTGPEVPIDSVWKHPNSHERHEEEVSARIEKCGIVVNATLHVLDAIILRRPILLMNNKTMPVLPPPSALRSYHTYWATPKNLLQEQILSAITHGPRSIDMIQAKRVIILCNLP